MKYIIFATVLNSHKMESKEYFEKIMQDHNQNRKGRSLRKYCKDEAVDYDWLIQYNDASFLPCDYVRHFEDGTDAEVTKTSQAVA